jgi:hypothetical protein
MYRNRYNTRAIPEAQHRSIYEGEGSKPEERSHALGELDKLVKADLLLLAYKVVLRLEEEHAVALL